MSLEEGDTIRVERTDLLFVPRSDLAPLGEGVAAAALRFPDLRPRDPLPGPPLPGRLAAREALRRLGRSGDDWLGRGEDRAPIWPAGFLGAISHSGGLAWSVAARAVDRRGLGVDVEGLVSPSAAEAVSKMVLVEGERQRLAAAGLDDRAGLTLAFAAKECLFKCLYPTVRKMFGFEAAELQWIDAGGGAFGLRLRVSLHPSLPEGATFSGRFNRMTPQGAPDPAGEALAAITEWR
jgi:enterobactin synthetase component D